MRSPELRGLALALLLAVAAPALPAGEAPSREQVDRAIETVKADPNMAGHRIERRLVWDDVAPIDPGERRVVGWVGDLFSWIGQTSQMLFWLLIAILVGFVVYLVARTLSRRTPRLQARSFVAPTHVQDLDIRPESLPADIGAAARAFWDRGEQRAALALLYRGLLSRLAHAYEVPIRDSSTEGDCLSLAARALDARRIEYATRLVRTWQAATYGGLAIDSPVVHELCAGFDGHLDRPVTDTAPRRALFAGGSAS